MLKEEFLHYIWKYKLYQTFELKSTEGYPVQILNSGIHNTNSGPDFFNGKIKVGDTIWVGNIEIHVKSSDWIKHHHQSDKAYNNVILHVVYQYDQPVYDKNGNLIPTIELKGLIDEKLFNKYDKLLNAFHLNWIPCENQINGVDHFTIKTWLSRLAIERLENKSIEINKLLKSNKNDWEQTFYQYLFKYFGLKINAYPFEQLAINTPLKIIEKHHNLFSIEALLYGQAGFLEENIEDEYYNQLKKEYHFLKNKFHLNPFDKSLWKLLRLRPSNFPAIRISQMAQLLNNNSRLCSKIIETETVSEIQNFFAVSASQYWNTHYQFNVQAKQNRIKNLGKNTINNIIINVIVPFTFVYGKIKQDENLTDKALNLMENIKPENNAIIKKWAELGLKPDNAMQTQSLIELKNNYCSPKKCLNCSIGNKIFQL